MSGKQDELLRDIAWIIAPSAPATQNDYFKAMRILTLLGKETRLYDAFIKWRDKIGISCAESVYQTDEVLLSAPEMILELCEIAGYTKEDESLDKNSH